MRTGNGRHRRPRQAPALVVAAGVTGSAMALPLLAATGAHAADASTWDRVALCESGGLWSADLGNGAYGGLQFSQKTWDQYGGTQYAARPDLASRAQQIAVAQKVLAAEGSKPWASCADISGLTESDTATPSVDPGAPDTASPTPSATDSASDPATPAPKSSASAPRSKGSASAASPGSPASPTSPGSSNKSGSSSKSHSSGPSDSANPSGSDSGSPSGSTSAPEGATGSGQGGTAGRHRGGEAQDGAGVGRDDSGRHASRSAGPARDTARTDGTYTVREGDNLWAIAEAHDLPGGWPALYEANQRTVGADPDHIVPGQSLDLDQKQG